MINDKEHEVIFAYRTITFYGIPFQGILANQTSSKCSPSDYSDVVFLQPQSLAPRYARHSLKFKN